MLTMMIRRDSHDRIVSDHDDGIGEVDIEGSGTVRAAKLVELVKQVGPEMTTTMTHMPN